ncbi:MAG: hypothetical protein CSB24_06625 [Deltaproteobacteria bacterium]|nr:MAG: hypothetical protein CSB24_06625 [Deltaproteobacteria bacterium]
MDIKKWIGAVSVLIALLLLATGFVLFSRLNAVQQQEKANVERGLSIQVAQELRQSSDDITLAARSYIMTGDKRYEQHFNDILAIRAGELPRPEAYDNIYWDFVFANHAKPRKDSGVAIAINKLAEEAGLTAEEMGYIEDSTTKSQNLAQLEIQAFNALKGRFEDVDGNYARIDMPDRQMAVSLLFGPEYFQYKAEIMEPLAKLYNSVQARTSKALADIDQRLASLNTWFVVLVIMLLVAAAVLGYLVYEYGQREVAERQAAQKKAEDENEQLNDSVIRILEAVNSLSQRDLTVRAPVTEDVIGTVSDSINLLAVETARVLKGVTEIAGEVSNVSDNVHAQAEQVSDSSKKERETVQHSIDTLFTATQTMNQVAALAEQTNQSAVQATEVTQDALTTVNRTVEGMESIRETISETEKRIKRLGERSQEISGIVNLINTISERTHVLALNASMQAAVAGEAGRGFAVVAQEVQQLAESSRNATEQIATLVNNIQIETNETINTVNHTISQVVEGSEQAQQAGEQMRRTQAITAELVASVQDIAEASDKQKVMSAELLEAVQAIGESAEQSSRQIEEQNKGTEKLQEAAKNLVESVNVFKLPDAA